MVRDPVMQDRYQPAQIRRRTGGGWAGVAALRSDTIEYVADACLNARACLCAGAMVGYSTLRLHLGYKACFSLVKLLG